MTIRNLLIHPKDKVSKKTQLSQPFRGFDVKTVRLSESLHLRDGTQFWSLYEGTPEESGITRR